MFSIFKKPQHRHRGGQIMGILLVIAVVIGMIAMYSPFFY